MPTTWSDEAEVGDALADEEATVHARQPDRVDAQVAQGRHQLAVDDAAQDGGGDLQSRRIGHAQAALESTRDAEPFQPIGDLRRPPPWTRTTGRRRATVATSDSTCR